MALTLKIINTILILFALFMGIKHGWAGIMGKPEVLEMFAKWNIGKAWVLILSILTLVSAAMLLFPQTFFWGNFI